MTSHMQRPTFYQKFYRKKLLLFTDLQGHYPSHSCKHIRDSGYPKGDGEYWIDPEKDGNLLKVYCDMKTDGGKW